MASSWWSGGEGGITLAVRVTPGAHRSEVVDTTGDSLRIRVAARAHEGKANAEVMRFVAELFGVRRSAVSLVRGARSRDKTLWIAGIVGPPAALLDR